MNQSNKVMLLPQPDSYIREIDLHFGRLMQELSDGNEEVFIASCLVSRATAEGHVCLNLSEIAGKEHIFFIKSLQRHESIKCPRLDIWIEKLRKSKVVGSPGEYKPLILDDCARLYLYRYWKYENILINELSKRISKNKDITKPSLLKKLLPELFPYKEKGLNLQMLSSIIPVVKYFCVITGGPGTGKTTTVAKILALLIALSDKKKLRIFLSAPTGKASGMLRQAIMKIKDNIDIDDQIKNNIPAETFTIHRMLRPIPKSPYFIYNRENRLPADVVVVDEASMVDLPLMSKLVQAISDDTTMIMLGDKDQLSSVEPGSVLGDICADATGLPENIMRLFQIITAGNKHNLKIKSDIKRAPINDCIIALKQSHRFSEKSGIAKLSRAVNEGDIKIATDILRSNTYSDIKYRKLPKPDILKHWLRDIVIKNYKAYLQSKDPLMAIKAFDSFRILSPVRWGPYGVRQINRLVETILQEQGLICTDEVWYKGRPIIINENDYELELFNGDVGIIMPDIESDGKLRAFFVDQDGQLKKILPIRLPEHETVFAMTVHKSQGSEFDNVLFILPDTYVSIITRELIYTAITRARNSIEIWGNMEIIEKGINQKIIRSSGLRDALWNQQCTS